jgi:hypothetical protein
MEVKVINPDDHILRVSNNDAFRCLLIVAAGKDVK